MAHIYSIDGSGGLQSVIKTTLLLSTALSVHLSLSPPNPSVKSEDCCSGTEGTETLFERVVQSITYCSKCMVWAAVVCNIIGIVIQDFMSSTALHLGSNEWPRSLFDDYASSSQGIHFIMTAGALSTAIAALLRLWCFKSLGQFFTFEITIRPRHQLVMHGPYAWVRHPSYTGVYFTLTGATLVLAAPGTWTGDYGIWSPIGAMVAIFWIFKCAFAFRGMVIRLRAEDEVLRLTFGDQWEDYAARVPFKFIPGLI